MTKLALLAGLALCPAACLDSSPDGLASTPPGTGPTVVFDLDARPLPEIPFPNDVATRPDPASPTGRRVNTSMISPTSLEGTVRERINMLAGFSTFAPASVAFDEPLDLEDLLSRHGADLDLSDDAVYLINLATGEPVLLDIGNGAYPYVLEKPSRYFPNDPRAGESNMVFETVNEDINGNGLLDPGEDTDSDGVLDRSNTLTPDGDPVDDLVTFYERETDTLILRPLVPLEQETTYAVVLTNRLKGADGQPVRSPFDYVNHTQQTADLAPLVGHLPNVAGLSVDDLAFCWSFTTQSTTRDLEDLRMGLYGQGPFAYLAEQFPAETLLEVAYDDPATATINPYVVPAAELKESLSPIAGMILGAPEIVDSVMDSYKYVDYIVLGRAQTPLMVHSDDGIFEMDAATGELNVSAEDLPYLVVIPKERPELGISAPFPVAIYVHGTGGFRIEAMGFGGFMARQGIATVGVDLYMHGMVLDEFMGEIFVTILQDNGLGRVAEAMLDNRAIDINYDGEPDPAGNFWSVDIFHTRDSVRQGALDLIRLIQVLRGFDGQRTWSLDADWDGVPDLEGLAGDFNGDGRVDLVGPQGPYFLFGISLGGIVSSVAAAVEPEVVAAAPISPGGGLIDIAVRSLQTGVPEMAVLPMMGPLLLGIPAPETEEPVLAFYAPNGRDEVTVPVHSLDGLRPGARIRAVNLRSGEEAWSLADQDLRFRLGLPCDQGDPLLVEAADGSWKAERFDRDVTWQGTEYPADSDLVSITDGFGVQRQTPDARVFLQIAQTAVDPGDPANYARYYWQAPMYDGYPGVAKDTNLALVVTIGDMNVPISTGAALGRAAGLIPYQAGELNQWYQRTPHQVLVDSYVLEGLERLKRFNRDPWNDEREILLDPDYLSEGTDEFDAPHLDHPLRLSRPGPNQGISVVRFLYPNPTGRHGIIPSDPRMPFNVHLYAVNAIARYFATQGSEWVDDLCLADDSCSFIHPPPD